MTKSIIVIAYSARHLLLLNSAAMYAQQSNPRAHGVKDTPSYIRILRSLCIKSDHHVTARGGVHRSGDSHVHSGRGKGSCSNYPPRRG